MREDFEAKNKQLLDEMPRFYNSRLDYFQPSFESLIRAQVRPRPTPPAGPRTPPWGDATAVPSPCPRHCLQRLQL